MQREYKRNKIYNLIVFTLLVAFFFVAVVGTTGAWFTDTKSANIDGNTPIVNVTLYNGASALSTDSEIILTAQSNTTDSTTLKFDINNASDSTQNTNIRVFVRAKVFVNWTDESLTDDVLDFVQPNFSTTFLSGISGTAKDAKIGNWIYYNDILSISTTGIPRFTIINNFTITGTMSSNASVSIYLEAIQGNNVGLDKWHNSSTGDMDTTIYNSLLGKIW